MLTCRWALSSLGVPPMLRLSHLLYVSLTLAFYSCEGTGHRGVPLLQVADLAIGELAFELGSELFSDTDAGFCSGLRLGSLSCSFVSQTWVQGQSPPLARCVNAGELPTLPHLPHCQAWVTRLW